MIDQPDGFYGFQTIESNPIQKQGAKQKSSRPKEGDIVEGYDIHGLSVVPRESWVAGQILLINTIETCYDNKVKCTKGKHIVRGPERDKIWKTRRFIVLSKRNDHCICIPIYTYKNQGLRYKPQGMKEAHIAIKDRQVRGSDLPEFNTKPNGFITADTYLQTMNKMSVAALDQPHSFLYIEPIKLIGNITSLDLGKLYNHYNRWNIMSDPNDSSLRSIPESNEASEQEAAAALTKSARKRERKNRGQSSLMEMELKSSDTGSREAIQSRKTKSQHTK
ncbi:MAG: hypothetical protein M1834_003886 [Cirrosporium novae-zelandiae]|nr:MAG: hypothetical protein M1834_003886 [Cirrosporium novae-zelandiae]